MLAMSSPLPPSADLIKEVARGFKTSVPLRSGLVDILRSEMTWEKENYSQPEVGLLAKHYGGMDMEVTTQ
jgi:hypothetical protein